MTALSQQTDTCFTELELKKIALKFADLELVKSQVLFLVQDTVMLHKEINRKEGVILRLIDQRNNFSLLNATLQAQVSNDKELISKQQILIDKVEKPKKRGLFFAAGVVTAFIISILLK